MSWLQSRVCTAVIMQKKMEQEGDFMQKRRAFVDRKFCVGCGTCGKVCPRGAIGVPKGIYAMVTGELCVGCGICVKACPASVITVRELTE